MTIEELLWEIKKIEKKMEKLGYKQRKFKRGKNGGILLDPNNPNDREWYEDDEAYGL